MKPEDQLVTLQARFSFVEDDRDDFDDDFCRLPEMNREEYFAFLRKRSQTRFGHVWSEYRQIMLDLADEYVNSINLRRAEIRRRIANLPDVRANCVVLAHEQSWLISEKSDFEVFRRCVVLLSMADYADDPSNQTALTEIYRQGENASIDVKNVIIEISKISSDCSTVENRNTTKNFLGDFAPTKEW